MVVKQTARSIKVSAEDHEWLTKKNQATGITITHIVKVALDAVRGKPNRNVIALLRGGVK